MCGGGNPPKVVKRNPQAEADAAANAAAQMANEELSALRRKRRQNSLLTTGAQGVDTKLGASLLANASGKSTLGT